MLTAMGGAPGILELGDLDVGVWENVGICMDGLVGPIFPAANVRIGVEDILDGIGAAKEHADDNGN